MKKKSAGKSAGVPFKKGADPRRGRGPAKGAPNAGRPRRSFTEFMARLRTDPLVQRAVRTAARDPESKSFGIAIRALSDYDPQRPANKVEHTHNLSPAERRQRIASILTEVATIGETQGMVS